MNFVHKKILQSIQKHDGEWGWYQLERVVNPRDLSDNLTLMDILRYLEREGYIEQRLSSPQNKYSITDAEKKALAETFTN